MSKIRVRLRKKKHVLAALVKKLVLRRVRAKVAIQCARRAPMSSKTEARESLGAYHNQVKWILTHGADSDWLDFCGMKFREFQLFYKTLHPYLKQPSRRATRYHLTLTEKVLLTLGYLRDGKSMTQMALYWMMSRQAIGRTVWEVGNAIIKSMSENFDCRPGTADEWSKIAERFKDRWQFAHCLGAVDAKHCAITRFGKTYTQTQSFKKFPSVVLLAVVDADYRIVHFNAGAPGARSDSGLWEEDNMGKAVSDNDVDFPPPCHLPGDPQGRLGEIGYFFVGDAAFTLSTVMMKPFGGNRLTKSQMYFNSRLSRARHVIEAVFGHISRRFRIVNKSYNEEDMTILILRTVCHIHNFLRIQRMDDPNETKEISESIDYSFGTPLLDEGSESPYQTGVELQEKLRKYYHLTVFD